MANKPLDTSLLDRAIIFAVRAHAGTERRGKGFPYIVHPMEAVEIVATMTRDQELLAAAALHDTVEDTDVTVEQIRAEFADNKLYYPTVSDFTVNACRAYFQLKQGLTAGEPANGVRAFVLNFGDDETTGIISVYDSGFMVNGSDAWYTLDGRRLDGVPTAKGLYIHGGRKVIVK